MNNVQIENKNSIMIRIIKGIGLAFAITLMSIFILSIILTYTNVSETIIPSTIIILTFISILIGAIISTKQTNKNGLVNGSIIGASYVILLYVISSLLNMDFSLNIYACIMIISGIMSGIIGGIIGVNIK